MLYGKYRFKCRLENNAIMPFYKGSTFRGVFGHALKRVVCALKRQECSECVLRSRCIYTLTFETPLSIEMPKGSRISSPPHPFVIEPPLTEMTQFGKGSSIDCDLILFGETNNSLPYFVYAFDQMGKIGIGKRVNGHRGQFKLKEVRACGTQVYSDTDQKLNQNDGARNLSMPVVSVSDEEHSKDVSQIRITLETPLRLKFKNRLKTDLPFHVLVRAMLRRISSLFSVYGNGEPDLDYKGLTSRAENVRIVKNDLNWFDWRRYSNRQERSMFMGGMTGTAVYEGELAEFLPLLDFCEKTHLGKGTSFGLGKVKKDYSLDKKTKL